MPRDTQDLLEVPVEVPVRNAEEIAILDGMAAQLGKEGGWCKRALEKDGAMCLMGALNNACFGTSFGKVEGWLEGAHKNVYLGLGRFAGVQGDNLWSELVDVNNADSTTQADILDLIARTRASFVAEQT